MGKRKNPKLNAPITRDERDAVLCAIPQSGFIGGNPMGALHRAIGQRKIHSERLKQVCKGLVDEGVIEVTTDPMSHKVTAIKVVVSRVNPESDPVEILCSRPVTSQDDRSVAPSGPFWSPNSE